MDCGRVQEEDGGPKRYCAETSLPKIKLESRFDALDSSSEHGASLDEFLGDASLHEGMKLVGSPRDAFLDTVEGNDGDRDFGASPEIGDRPVDEDWPLGSLVKWKSPDHPGILNITLV